MYAESDRVRETQQLGAGSFIKKPFTLERIGLAIRKEIEDDLSASFGNPYLSNEYHPMQHNVDHKIKNINSSIFPNVFISTAF